MRARETGDAEEMEQLECTSRWLWLPQIPECFAQKQNDNRQRENESTSITTMAISIKKKW